MIESWGEVMRANESDKSTGIGRRVHAAAATLQSGDPEGCLVLLFPAIDAIGKRRGFRTRTRIRGFIDKHEALIMFISSGGKLLYTGGRLTYGGKTLSKVLYELNRATRLVRSVPSAVHEAEALSVTYTDSPLGGTWSNFHLPAALLWGLLLCVVAELENKNQKLPSPLEVEFKSFHTQTTIDVESLWGDLDGLKKAVGFDAAQASIVLRS